LGLALNRAIPDRGDPGHSSVDSYLLHAARDLAFARDLDSVMAIVKTTARQVTGADGVTFVLRDGNYCHYADEDAIAPLWKGRRFPLEQCVSGWVLRRGEPVSIPDVYSDPRVPHDAYRVTFVKSLAMVPVLTPDPVAAIGAYWATPHNATGDELRSLRLLADSAALALANIHLYQELRASLEQQQDARRAAEAATAAKDNFLAIVAHELRQPLAAATAAMSLLRAEPAGNARARAHNVMERQLLRMTRLVEDLLDAARIVRGEFQLQIRTLDLRDVVQGAVDSVRPAIDERQHLLTVSMPEGPNEIEGDGARLEQVLVNLLQNAARYTPQRGAISVSLTGNRERAVIAVRDNGQGIAAERLGAIFELFTRGSSGGDGGFGIGLAVARTLVERHGGSLVARSAGLARGSEFTLSLPRQARPARQSGGRKR
jgi:signal transduction histidine kinase